MSKATLGLDDLLPFGKHEGQQVEDVIHDDPSYIEWIVAGGVFDFDEETLELITKRGIA